MYLYGDAARVDSRRTLPAIRAGEYEALPEKVCQAVRKQSVELVPAPVRGLVDPLPAPNCGGVDWEWIPYLCSGAGGSHACSCGGKGWTLHMSLMVDPTLAPVPLPASLSQGG